MKMQMLVAKGPYRISFQKQKSSTAKFVDKEHASRFWQSDTDLIALAKKQGCYIFAIRVGMSLTPWYVGRAARPIAKECFQNDKLQKYNKALFRKTRGTPVMYFVVPQGNKNVVRAPMLKDIEKFLIQTALAANPNLINKVNTKNLPKWGIKGVIRGGLGKPKECKKFAKMMGM